MGKHLSYNFHIWKNAYHRVFIQFSVRMELYDKKFLIYGNCMIRSIGQPGKLGLEGSKILRLTATDKLRFLESSVFCYVSGACLSVLSALGSLLVRLRHTGKHLRVTA